MESVPWRGGDGEAARLSDWRPSRLPGEQPGSWPQYPLLLLFPAAGFPAEGSRQRFCKKIQWDLLG